MRAPNSSASTQSYQNQAEKVLVSDVKICELGMILHILTPGRYQSPTELAGEVFVGDLVADFGRFPPSAFEIETGGVYRDITERWLTSRDYWTIARNWLVEFTEKTRLQDILSIDNYGFWWTYAGQKFVAGLTERGNTFAWIDLLHAISNDTRPASIVVYGGHEAILHLVREIYGDIPVEIQDFPAEDVGRRARVPRHMALLAVRLLISLLYLVYTLFRKPQILLLSNTNLIRKTGSSEHQRLRDIYLGEVKEALQLHKWRVAVVEMYGWNASWAGLVARGFFFPSDLLMLLSSLGWTRLGFYRKIVCKWRDKWKVIRSKVVSNLCYRGYDVAPLIEPLVAQVFLDHAPHLELMVRFWKCLLQFWHPRLLYINNSYGKPQMTAIIAAKSLHIPTVEQQHGLIGRNHIAYLVPRNLELATSFPLCDWMLVWGAYTQRFLVDAGVYRSDQIVVSGFPRADMLLRNLPSKDETRMYLDVPRETHLVLYTSNGFAQDLLDAILDGIQLASSSDIHWLIKLHPREKTRLSWERAIQERNLGTVQVLESEFDFYALLNACDIHVSFASTTLIESAILGKPNLGIDVPHLVDPGGYAEAQAFLPVTPEQLGLVVRDLLENPANQAQLLAVQGVFAHDWCLHDGASVLRIVHFLESLVSEEEYRCYG